MRLPERLFHAGARVASEPPAQAHQDPFAGCGDSHERMYQRSLGSVKPAAR